MDHRWMNSRDCRVCAQIASPLFVLCSTKDKYQSQHTQLSSTHSIGNSDLYKNTKDGNLHSMENIVPSEPGNERNMFRRENVLLCDKCCRENVRLCELCPYGRGSKMQATQLDYRKPSMSDNSGRIQEDYQRCTGSHRLHSSTRGFAEDMGDKGIHIPMDYQECLESHGLLSLKGNSSKCLVDVPCACRITHHQSRSSLSSTDKNQSIHLSRLKCSQTRPLTHGNPNVINQKTTQKEMESIRQITYSREEDKLPHSLPTVPRIQKDRYTKSKSDKLTVFQPLYTEQLTYRSQQFTQKPPDKLPFQGSTKCPSVIYKCTPKASHCTLVTSFQDKVSQQQKSLPSQCKLPQYKVSGNNPTLFLYHSAVTLLKRTRSPSVFTNSLLILLFMFTLLPLHTQSATNGIPCLYKGSLKSDRSWFGFLTNITIMNTGRMTFQFSYPAEKCCQNILFYLEDQVSILNARMNCWQKESLLRPEDDQILRLTPRFSWSGCHLSHPNGYVRSFLTYILKINE